MNAHVRLILILLIVIVLGESALRLLLPWLSYDRLFWVCAIAFFLATATLLVLARRSHQNGGSVDDVRPKVRLLQAFFFFCAGVATLVFKTWVLHQ
jgi:uncharacterized membrane protein YfcA